MPTFTRDSPVATRQPTHRRARRQWGKGLAVGLLIACLVVFIAGVLKHFSGDDSPSVETPAATAPADPAMGADGKAPMGKLVPNAPACHDFGITPTGSMPDLVTVPPTDWQLVGGMATPHHKSTGPAKTTGGVRNCYANTPAGALFGVANYLAQQQDPKATPESETALALQSMSDTPLRGRYIQEWAKVKTGEPPPISGADVRPQFVAFHFVAYTPDMAIIDMAFAWNGRLDAAVYTAHYVGGDWRLDPPDNPDHPGRWPMRQLPVEDPNYWTHWSAE